MFQKPLTGFIRDQRLGNMSSKTSNLTYEQLMEIIDKDKSSIPKIKESSNLGRYIRENGIKDGPISVPNFVIYHHYCKVWNPMGRKISKIEFMRQFSKLFESRRTGSTRFYKLDDGTFDISKEGKLNAKDWDARKRRKKKNEKRKKSEKLPRIKEGKESQ